MTVRRIAVACLVVAMVSGPIATAGQTPTLDKIYGWMKKSFAPETPNTPSPVSGAMTVARPVTLTWVSTGADTYDVRLGTTSTPTTVASGLTTASYTPANLLAGTKYYWQIVAKNISGGGTPRSSIGPLWNFTTATATLPPVDCVLSAWSAWSACSQSGTQTRTRTILTAPANGGLACGPVTETQSCTSIPPPPTPITTGPVTTSMVVGFYAGNTEPLLYQYRVRVDGGSPLTMPNVTCVDPTPPDTAALCSTPVIQALADALNVRGSHALTMTAYEPVAAVESAPSPAFVLTTP